MLRMIYHRRYGCVGCWMINPAIMTHVMQMENLRMCLARLGFPHSGAEDLVAASYVVLLYRWVG